MNIQYEEHEKTCIQLNSGNSVKVPLIQVQTAQQKSGYLNDNNLGLKSMMLFRKVHFNLVDMVFSTEL